MNAIAWVYPVLPEGGTPMGVIIDGACYALEGEPALTPPEGFKFGHGDYA